MAKLPPQPLGVAPGSSYWNDWYEKLRTFVEQITTSVDWTIITGTPTTLAGYGITNGQTTLTNSAGLAAALSDETGTGLAVFNNTPTLITPNIGAATGTSLVLAGALSGVTDLTTTGNTTLGNASTDTLNVGNGELIKASGGAVTITPASGVSLTCTGTTGSAIANFVSAAATNASVGITASGTRAWSLKVLTSGGSFTITDGSTDRMTVDISGNTGIETGQLSVKTVGKGLSIKEGSNAKMGVATLVAGTVVVSTTAVTASSRIFLTSNTDGGTVGFQRVSGRTAGTSFTITSSSATDTSTIAWVIFEPS